MNEPVDTFEYKGFEVKIYPDLEPFDPREDPDSELGNMICFHGRYNLGDKHDFADSIELEEFLKESGALWLPLYLYDHSGITMRTSAFSCQWDSGQVGIIYVTKKVIRDRFKVHNITKKVEKQAFDHLRMEVKTYDEYLTGQVYGYDWEHGSCYGFFGDDQEYMHSEVKSEIDYYLAEQRKDRLAKLKQFITNKVPLEVRSAFIKDFGTIG